MNQDKILSGTYSLSSSSANPIKEKLIYSDVIGNSVDLQIIQNSLGRGLEYVIKKQPNNSNVTHMVFEESVVLPTDWFAVLSNTECGMYCFRSFGF